MESFMVVCTFTPETVMAEAMTVVAGEQVAVGAMKEQGRIGSVCSGNLLNPPAPVG